MTTRLRELRTRGLDDAAVALREADAAAPVFVGKPIVYNSRTAIGNPLKWGFYEEVARGAATKTLQEGDIRFLVDHDTSMPVSRSSAGTLRLVESDGGVDVNSDLNTAKSYVADLVENLRDKTITGMSFGFIVTKDEWSTVDVTTADGQTVEADLRVIKEFRLLEVSAVTFPAYEDTEAGLRKMASAVRSLRNGTLDADELAELEALQLAGRAAGERQPAEATGAPESQPAAATVPAQLLFMRGDDVRFRMTSRTTG